MKELTLEEVLRIKGGTPLTAALDEVTYRSPLPAAVDAVDYAKPETAPHPSEPA